MAKLQILWPQSEKEARKEPWPLLRWKGGNTINLRGRGIPPSIHHQSSLFSILWIFNVKTVPMLTPAHRGSGFVYQDAATKLHYVQGIIYFTGTLNGPTITFTNMFINVSAHIDWINFIRQKTEKRLHRDVVLNSRIVKNTTSVCKSLDNQNENGLRSEFDSSNEQE